MTSHKPLIYSCSGCSNVAQLANQVAIEFDREGLAEMSCIVGVGGHVKSLLKKAKQAPDIIALDGCPLHCVKNCLKNHDIIASTHITLSDYGIKKRKHFDFLQSDVTLIKSILLNQLSTQQQS